MRLGRRGSRRNNHFQSPRAGRVTEDFVSIEDLIQSESVRDQKLRVNLPRAAPDRAYEVFGIGVVTVSTSRVVIAML